MSEQVSKKVIFLLPDNGKSAMKRLLNQMGSNHSFEFVIANTADDALMEVANCNYGLLLIETIDKPTTTMATTVLKKGKKYRIQ